MTSPTCISCRDGLHYCAGAGCPCFCDAPGSYWAPDAHVCDICEACEDDLGPSIVTVELPGVGPVTRQPDDGPRWLGGLLVAVILAALVVGCGYWVALGQAQGVRW